MTERQIKMNLNNLGFDTSELRFPHQCFPRKTTPVAFGLAPRTIEQHAADEHLSKALEMREAA